MTDNNLARTERIRDLNDKFRQTFEGGRVMITQGVRAKGEAHAMIALSMVRTFTAFDEGDDPFQEHDFGAFNLKDEKHFWKIDYYDTSVEYGSEDPSDPDKTTRVLTLMLASEY